MCRINKTEVSGWQRRTDAQLETTQPLATDLAIRAAQKPGPDTAFLAGIAAVENAAALVIPIRWRPVHSWPKAIRVAKSRRV